MDLNDSTKADICTEGELEDTEQNGEPLVWNKNAQFKMDVNDGRA